MTRIYIPTAGRPYRQLTYGHLPRSEDVVLVTPEKDAEEMDFLGYPVLPSPAQGIAPVRQWILQQHDVEKHGPKLIMMDDDLRFFERRRDDPGKFIQAEGEGFSGALREMELGMEYAPMVGLANRGGGNRKTQRFTVNTRNFDVWGVHVPTVREELGLQIDETEFMEDFNLALHLLTRGHAIPTVNRYSKDDDGSNSAGGCSTYRDYDSQMMAAFGLESAWPDFVAAVEKTSKNWAGGMSSRWDVRIQWAKAYAYGVKTHGEQNPLPGWMLEEAWAEELL